MFRRNLVSLMVNPGTYNGRDEERLIWDSGFDSRRATRPILTGNAVAGSERAGYRVDGEPCEETTERWADNTAHSVLIGVMMLHEDCLTSEYKVVLAQNIELKLSHNERIHPMPSL